MDEKLFDYETMVSETGTRHVLAKATALCHQGRRKTALCGFGVLIDLVQMEVVRDCEFCLVELAEIRKRTG
jgi:hypothetical protein